MHRLNAVYLKTIEDYVKIQKLPFIQGLSSIPQPFFGRIVGEKGETILLNNEHQMKYISILDLRKGFGSRGNHYHREKHEFIFVLRGKAQARFWLPENPRQIFITTVEEGELIYIKPGCAHAFFPLENVLMVEFSPQAFDSADQISALPCPENG